MTQAIILLGGKGTRIQSRYADRPKALVPVAGKPFLQWQIEWLARNNVNDVHLAAGYMADTIAEWLAEAGDVAPPRATRGKLCERITVSEEPEPLGTAGGLKFIEDNIRGNPFLVLNGDSLLPRLDFQGLEKTHAQFSPDLPESRDWKKPTKKFQPLENSAEKVPTPTLQEVGGKNGEKVSNAWKTPDEESQRVSPKTKPPMQGGNTQCITIAVSRIEQAGRYGTVEFDADRRITAFREKAEHAGGWINAGVYLVERAALELIEPGRNLSIETDIFPVMASRGLLRAFPAQPPMLDMGTPDGLDAMEHYLKNYAAGRS